MSNSEIILTPAGRQKLVDELAYLEGEKTTEIIERLKAAREFGDLSENSEYDDARDEQARVQARIAEIRATLSAATVSEEPSQTKQAAQASIGSTVEVEDERGRVASYTIVGTTETNSLEHRISNESPMGAALMGRRAGETISYSLPNGRTRSFKIVKVQL